MAKHRSLFQKILLFAGIVCFLGMIPVLLFAVNGLVLAHNEEVVTGLTSHPAVPPAKEDSGNITLRVMSWNVAKLFVHNGGLSFDPPEKARKRLQSMADLIRAEKPDIVFLCEIIKECTPCPVDQIAELAEATGMHMWTFGENYNFGLPFYRIVGGNAILSRFPIQGVTNLNLIGRQPFYVTKNNRRALWCSARIGEQEVLMASLHNDSYSRKNNLAQAQQILAYTGKRDTLMAGDFNAAPHEPPMKVFSESNLFSGVFDGPFTFPAGKPRETIDFILGPAAWEVLEHRVIASDASDHLPVLTVFGVKKK